MREGAAYWRNSILKSSAQDPITYDYVINGVTYKTLRDIEANDPAFGEKYVSTTSNKLPKNASEARKAALICYFLRWATGNNTYTASIASDSYADTEIPAPSVDFQEIERTFGLWYQESGEPVKKFLANLSNGPELALKWENVTTGTYANGDTLSKIYKLGSNGELGKLIGPDNEKVIRTDVKLREDTNNDFVTNRFTKFYFGNDTIIDYSTFDKPNSTYSVPRSAMNDALSAFVEGLKKSNEVSVEQLKNNEGTGSLGETEDSFKEPEQFRDKDLKLACYIALKNMYDRWLCSRRRENWYFSCQPDKKKVNGIESDFRRFYYIDEFYHNIGMRIKPNLTDFVETMTSEGGFSDKSDEFDLEANSILKMLSTTAQYAGCSLLTLPMMLGLARDGKSDSEQNSVCDVFKAFPYNDAVTGTNIETSFVVLYSNQKSSILDVEDQTGEKNAYKSDGFDLADTWGKIVPQPMFTDSDGEGYVVPCFGVTFAKQNQSYFSNVRLSMEDHQITEYSIRNEVMISYANNRGPRETTIVGQDLYSVFSNYSYSCSVEMLGDAQITPLMYFQLNNIAMWKGAYLITEVSHDITPSGFRTVFKGTRQARPALPFKGDEMIIEANGAAQKTPYSQNNGEGVVSPNNGADMSERPLDKINVDNISSAVITLHRVSTEDRQTWANGTLSIMTVNNDGTRTDYDNIATTRERLNGIPKSTLDNTDLENKTAFALPFGVFTEIKLEEATPKQKEYRDANDFTYSFTNGKHIMIGDTTLGNRQSEIVPGNMFYDLYKDSLSEISSSEISPIILFGNCDGDFLNEFDENEVNEVYREIFNFIERVNAAGKPLKLLVATEAKGLPDKQNPND